MRLAIILKSELSEEQVRYLDGRLAAPEHKDDHGPTAGWHTHQSGLYAFIHRVSKLPIAIASASGPVYAIVPAWWIDMKFRGQGYGNELVDRLAAHLKKEGYTGVGKIAIDTYGGKYLDESTKLAERFKAHFGKK